MTELFAPDFSQQLQCIVYLETEGDYYVRSLALLDAPEKSSPWSVSRLSPKE